MLDEIVDLAEVVVDDVEDHAEAELVGPIDQRTQLLGRAVGCSPAQRSACRRSPSCACRETR